METAFVLVLFVIGTVTQVTGKITTCQLQTNYKAFSKFAPNRFAVSLKAAQNLTDLSEDEVAAGNVTNKPDPSSEATKLADDLFKQLGGGASASPGGHSRTKRASPTLPEYKSPAGSIDINGLVNVCGSKSVVTDLGVDFYPRYLNEIVCDGTGYCLMGQGACVQNVMYLRFKRATRPEHTYNNIEDWTQYDQAVRVSCCCKLYQDGVFTVFV